MSSPFSSWRVSKSAPDAIVSDEPSGHDASEAALEYYGGHLVAESVAPQHRALIAAAPLLLEQLQGLVTALRRGGPFGIRLALAEDAVREALTGVTLRERIRRDLSEWKNAMCTTGDPAIGSLDAPDYLPAGGAVRGYVTRADEPAIPY